MFTFRHDPFNVSLPFFEQFGVYQSMISQIFKQEANPVSDKNLLMSKNKTKS